MSVAGSTRNTALLCGCVMGVLLPRSGEHGNAFGVADQAADPADRLNPRPPRKVEDTGRRLSPVQGPGKMDKDGRDSGLQSAGMTRRRMDSS